MLKRFEGLGGKVRFAHRFLDATQDADGVDARIETPSGIETMRGSYLVGADGGKSAVRHGMNVAFEGFTWPERFLVVGIDRDLAPEGFTMNAYVSDPVDWSAIFKMPHDGPPGLWRVLFPTDAELPEEEVLDAGFVEKSCQNFLPWDRPYGIVHKSTYRVHQRVASDFRRGRFLLVGDAAHLNNPLGAFGLNGALHAAFNLAPKLAAVWRANRPRVRSIFMSASAAPPTSNSCRRNRSATSSSWRSAIPLCAPSGSTNCGASHPIPSNRKTTCSRAR